MVLAADTEEQFGDFKDDEISYYYLDAVPEDFGEDKGIWEETKDKFWFLDMQDKFGQKMNELFNFLTNTAFELNMFMTRMMITALDIAYDFEFVNSIINKLDEIMAPITGITGTGAFSNSGLFGNFAKFVAVITVIYAVYVLIWKRSMFSSITTILQTVIALTIAVLLFSNYSSFLLGLNQVTTEASALILSGTHSQPKNGDRNNPNLIIPDTPTGLNEKNLQNKMRDNLWSMFVDRPYLYMMYGETSLEKLDKNGDRNQSVNRVKEVLKQKPKSEARYEAIIKEKDVKRNKYVTYSNISKRLSFTPMYLSINGITSVPIYFLALTLILFQFWFMIIALFAPFALLIGAIPGQFNVLKRYFIELGLPLILKMLVSFAALVIFALSELLYQADFAVNNSGGNAFFSYITVAIVHFVLFMLIFLLRKRISNIFSAGTKGINDLREGMGAVTNPLKKGVHGTTTATGLAVGAVTTGGIGAMAGANIGGSVGKMATGEGDVREVANSAFQAKRAHQLAELKGLNGKQDATPRVNNLSNDRADNMNKFINDTTQSNNTQEKTDDVLDSVDKEGTKDVSMNEQPNPHSIDSKKIQEEAGTKENYSALMVEGKKPNKQIQQKSLLGNQVESKEEYVRRQQVPKTSDWMEESSDINANPAIEQMESKPEKVPIPTANDWIEDTPEMVKVDAEKEIQHSHLSGKSDIKHNYSDENNIMSEYDDSYANLASLENHMLVNNLHEHSHQDEYANLKDWDRGE
ncbi:hypothetical protein CIL03_08440 [Virgibacillus indicus]|uniref:Uncharacterized protein n=1 Tax=Virgibacillus indicus TaxID=2024554 RepID=A0A265NCN4_9BACI|nr:hypothetical protein [Virgibacillus indicus]OZU89036.1 hypothetical protein CIL03_08440 [Virgibacillus indicus]